MSALVSFSLLLTIVMTLRRTCAKEVLVVLSRSQFAHETGVESETDLQDKHFKMAAAEGKFVWLETLRKARKTSLVQDGKWRILALTLWQMHSLNSYGVFIADSHSIWQPVIIYC